jgi:hypothetical protein
MKMQVAALVVASVALVGCGAADTTMTSAPSVSPRQGMPFAIDRLTESFSGTAQEVLRVSGYTYVAVDTGSGVRWAVSLQRDIDEGARVSVRAFGKKHAFESKKLGRTFDELWFAIITPVPVPATATVTEGASS